MNDGCCDGAGGAGPGREAADALAPAVLAYVGDAAFGLLVRTLVLERCLADGRGGCPGLAELHREVAPLVSAEAQARLLLALWPALTPYEQEVVRRARNAKTRHRPRRVGYLAYRRSTGLEALVGYLYLKGQADRLIHLLEWGLAQHPHERPGADGTV